MTQRGNADHARQAVAKSLPLDRMLKVAGEHLQNEDCDEAARDMQKVAGSGYEIRYMGGNNNRNFLVKHKETGAEFVLQYTSTNRSAEKMSQDLSKIPGIATVYASATSAVKLDKDQKRTYSGEPLVALRLMEKCVSDVGKAASNERSGKDVPYVMAASAVRQVSALLDGINKLNEGGNKDKVLWTDLKLGNLLIRANGEMVVADTKAIKSQKSIPTKDGFAQLVDVSNELLSRDFYNRIDKIKPADLPLALEREYSYQLGNILYEMAGGKPLITDTKDSNKNNQKNRDSLLEFGPEFASEKGKALQYLIRRLTDPNPANRISCGAAAELLSDKQKLDMLVKSSKNITPPDPAKFKHATQADSSAKSSTATLAQQLSAKSGALKKQQPVPERPLPIDEFKADSERRKNAKDNPPTPPKAPLSKAQTALPGGKKLSTKRTPAFEEAIKKRQAETTKEKKQLDRMKEAKKGSFTTRTQQVKKQAEPSAPTPKPKP